MKKFIFAIALIVSIHADALDWTYSTNLFWGITSPTNIYNGTNGTDTGADTTHIWATKLNADMNLIWNIETNNAAGIATLQTNSIYLSPSPALVLGTPWTNIYGAKASLIVDGYISMAVAGSSTLTFTNLTTTENHVFAGSTVSIAGTTYFSQPLPSIAPTNIVEIIVSNTGTASATLTKTTLRVLP